MSTPSQTSSTQPGSADDQLVKGIGLWGATFLVIGSVIGSGIFLTTGLDKVFDFVDDKLMALATLQMGG